MELKVEKAKNICLIAVDDSDAVPLIVDFIESHNWKVGTEFKIVHAIAPMLIDHPFPSYPLFLESVESEVRECAEKLLSRVKAKLKTRLPDFKIDMEILSGIPADAIIREAEKLSADLIVVGSHGRSGLARFFLGSVSGAVVSHAPCNVMVVRIPHRKVKETWSTKELTRVIQSSYFV